MEGGGMNEHRMNKQTDKNSPRVLQDFVPFGAAALNERGRASSGQLSIFSAILVPLS